MDTPSTRKYSVFVAVGIPCIPLKTEYIYTYILTILGTKAGVSVDEYVRYPQVFSTFGIRYPAYPGVVFSGVATLGTLEFCTVLGRFMIVEAEMKRFLFVEPCLYA